MGGLELVTEEYNLYDMDWMSADYFKVIEDFKEKYDLDMPLIFIAVLSIDFMNQRMDCASCEIDESYFEEFYTYIKEAERKQ